MKSFNIKPLQSTPAVFFIALFLAVSGQTFGQAVSLTPSPTGPDDLVTLTIDVSQSQENGLKTVLEANPDLHEVFWKAAKLCSACKVEVSAVHAQELMDAVEEIHAMFWAVKGRDVPWIRAS